MCKEDRTLIKLLESRIQQLEVRIQQAEGENKRLREENKQLRKRIELLEANRKPRELPPFFKPNRKKGNGRRGAKPGHRGYHRPKPDHIDEEIPITMEKCPDCGALLGDSYRTTDHHVEDIKPPTQPYVTKYDLHWYYCPDCKKPVHGQPMVLPKCNFGLNLMLLVCFQKYALGLPFNKIAFELWMYFGIKVSEGELADIVQRIAELFGPRFEELKEQMRYLKVKYIDETGWRINGENHWLWAFITEKVAIYKIDKSRGSKVPQKILGKDPTGVIVSDCLSAYNNLGEKQQKCWVHVLRDTSKLAKDKEATEEMKRFHRRVKGLYRDSVSFAEKKSLDEEKQHTQKIFLKRLDDICDESYRSLCIKRIAKRLRKHRESMFTFVVDEDVKPDNNAAERGIRPNVVIRKISGGNRSENGARAHEVMMSIMQTYKLQNLNFFDEGMSYLQGQLTLGE